MIRRKRKEEKAMKKLDKLMAKMASDKVYDEYLSERIKYLSLYPVV